MVSVLNVLEIRFDTKNVNKHTRYWHEFCRTFTKVIMIVITFRYKQSFVTAKNDSNPKINVP